MPDSTILMDYVLHRLAGLVKGLRIIPENIEKNLKASMGLYFSQRVLLALVESGLPRQEAYVMVQKVAMHCWENHVQFPDAVRADPDISKRLGAAALDELFDPGYYLRFEDAIFGRVFEGHSSGGR